MVLMNLLELQQKLLSDLLFFFSIFYENQQALLFTETLPKPTLKFE